MKTKIPEQSSNWIAQETRSQAAVGKKLEICNLQEVATYLLHYQKLMTSVEHSATTTNSPKILDQHKSILIFFSINFCTYKKIS